MIISIQCSAVWLTALLLWTRGPVSLCIMLWAGLAILLIRVLSTVFCWKLRFQLSVLRLRFKFSSPKYSICIWSMHAASVGKSDLASSGSHHFCCSHRSSIRCRVGTAVCSQGPERVGERRTFPHPAAPASPPPFGVTLSSVEHHEQCLVLAVPLWLLPVWCVPSFYSLWECDIFPADKGSWNFSWKIIQVYA